MILVVSALEQELGDQFKDVTRAIIGIGKVNATFQLTSALGYMIYHMNVPIHMVLNFGTAASAFFPKGTLVSCMKFIERDMVCDLPEFTNNNPATIALPRNYAPELLEATCYTGDSFLNWMQCKQYDGVIDMEAFALAKVCQAIKVPFCSIKYVTDGQTPNSELEWRRNMRKAQTEFREHYDLISNTLMYNNDGPKVS
jgi:adenosylhomocysteine nucleosidase